MTAPGRRPPRVVSKPRPEQWSEDELLTLEEAAALFWPDGPLGTRSLRTAVRKGELGSIVVARKLFTTRRLVERMCRGGG